MNEKKRTRKEWREIDVTLEYLNSLAQTMTTDNSIPMKDLEKRAIEIIKSILVEDD